MRTRIKVCGMTRTEDATVAVDLGVDAIGLVFYPQSPRYVNLEQAHEIARAVSPFVELVGLFVNASSHVVRETLSAVPLHSLQFHGDEDVEFCQQFERPFYKAARVRAGFDLLQYAASFSSAHAILLDTFVAEFGGSGQAFDWTLIPQSLPRPIILSGGLNADNVAAAVRQVRPAAVDVSSGVEHAKGIKDHAAIAAFIAGVRYAEV